MKITQQQPVRGEVYLCQFDPGRGSEQAGTRPAVIVERFAFFICSGKTTRFCCGNYNQSRFAMKKE